MTSFRSRKVKHLPEGDCGPAQCVHFTGMLMSKGQLVYDLQAESSGWLFESPLAGAWHIVPAAVQAAQFVIVCILFAVFFYLTCSASGIC